MFVVIISYDVIDILIFSYFNGIAWKDLYNLCCESLMRSKVNFAY